MGWLGANWIWIVVVGGMLWMHLGMHRGHGGHGGHSGRAGALAPQDEKLSTGHGSHAHDRSRPASAEIEAESGAAAGHRHRGC